MTTEPRPTSIETPDYLSLLEAGADIALTAPQPAELLSRLAASASSTGRRLTIHRAELIEASVLRAIAERAGGQVTLQFSHTHDAQHP